MHPDIAYAIQRLSDIEAVHGYDPFGFRPDVLRSIMPSVHFLYRRWFRVEVTDIDRIPDGRVLLIANHSGQLPFDGMMIGCALLLEVDPPRMVRSMVERFVPTVPFVSVLFARLGQVVGTRANARALLHRDNAVLVFPEGARGISKTFGKRYQLEEFGLGFMRLALQTDTPIVPIGVVGAEEQLPSFYNARTLARAIGAPALPIVPTPLPLPVKYRIYFGEPMRFVGDPNDEDRIVRSKVDEVTSAIDDLIARGLRERRGVFH